MAQYASSTVGTASPSHVSDELNTADMYLNLQIFVPELQLQKCLTVSLDELVWDIKRKLFAALPQALPQSFNFGLFLPPCDGRAGKFLLEDRPIRDYPFHDCVPYVELKYKKRVYKMLKLDEKSLKQLHSKSNLKKFMDYVVNRNSDKVDKWCAQGLDPNFHDSMGETPLTLAAGIAKNRDVIMSLIAGGAHIDFRNSEGQTAMHKAAFLSMTENVKTLLELGASPNYKDPIGLSPLYYCNLTTDSQEGVAQMLLAEAAEIGTMDMHGNHEIHQACKNGLLKHVENLLYYGAEINAQNINGNTPLHVCSVNNRPDCARVLLFRGADPFIMNKQGQTALHVAHIVGNNQVAEMIQSHNPSNSVPYRGTPKYSTRRRMGSQIIRRRSLSQSSLCSAQFDRCYQTPQGIHQSAMPSPSPSRASINNSSEYGTLRRIPPEAVQNQLAGFEPNIPRILVIPRGQKGFGFILRGTKHVEDITFQPTAETPALQFFEGVEMTGMAMKAGLRPGDFLLEINGVDVRCSNHEQVVHLIHQSQDTITLKVITIDQQNGYASQPHYATTSGTLPIRRNNSVPRNGLPPMPPQRNPNTALTSHTYGHHSGHHTMGYSPDSSDNNSLNYIYQASGDFRNMPGTKSSDTLSIQSIDSINYSDQNRCASVKSRPTARRISAAELEHLMIRQGTSQFQPIHYEQDPYNQNGPKKFTSIANMKRQKQRNGVPSPSMNRLPRTTSGDENGQQPIYEAQHQPLKSFSSSPDLQSAFQPHLRKQSTDSTSDYSKPYRSMLRPKTPPPAIPTSEVHTSNSMQSTTSTVTVVNNKADKVSVAQPANVPPPPPLPGNFLSSSPQKSSLPSTSSVQPVQSTPSDPSKSDCRGISAEALCNVRLKPVNNTGNGNAPNVTKQIPTSTTNEVPNSTPKTPNTKPPLDFDSDLRSALAKRRSKVCSEDDTSEATAVKPQMSLNNGTPASRYGGLSLRESVRENVSAPPKLPTKQHSPPGFATKKDSGYTSSRTSLEEQSILTPLAVTPNTPPNTTTIRITENPSVTLISQHLEDSFITQQSVGQPCKTYTDTVSITSSLSSSDNPNFQSNQIGTRRYLTTSDPSSPPIDYENSDSGTGDSDHDSCATVAPSAISNDSGLPNPSFGNDFYKQKSLIEWDCVDVYDWLHGLELSEYANSFFSNNISGVDLKSLNRASFIQLNVTRVAHRKAIEESIRSYTADKN